MTETVPEQFNASSEALSRLRKDIVPEKRLSRAVWEADELFRAWISGKASDDQAHELLNEFICRYNGTRVPNVAAKPNDFRNGATLMDECKLTLQRAIDVCDAIDGCRSDGKVSDPSERRRLYARELAVLRSSDPEFGP
jgi:hypothetical protein